MGPLQIISLIFSLAIIGAIIMAYLQANKCKKEDPDKSYGKCFIEVFLNFFGISLETAAVTAALGAGVKLTPAALKAAKTIREAAAAKKIAAAKKTADALKTAEKVKGATQKAEDALKAETEAASAIEKEALAAGERDLATEAEKLAAKETKDEIVKRAETKMIAEAETELAEKGAVGLGEKGLSTAALDALPLIGEVAMAAQAAQLAMELGGAIANKIAKYCPCDHPKREDHAGMPICYKGACEEEFGAHSAPAEFGTCHTCTDAHPHHINGLCYSKKYSKLKAGFHKAVSSKIHTRSTKPVVIKKPTCYSNSMYNRYYLDDSDLFKLHDGQEDKIDSNYSGKYSSIYGVYDKKSDPCDNDDVVLHSDIRHTGGGETISICGIKTKPTDKKSVSKIKSYKSKCGSGYTEVKTNAAEKLDLRKGVKGDTIKLCYKTNNTGSSFKLIPIRPYNDSTYKCPDNSSPISFNSYDKLSHDLMKNAGGETIFACS